MKMRLYLMQIQYYRDTAMYKLKILIIWINLNVLCRCYFKVIADCKIHRGA